MIRWVALFNLIALTLPVFLFCGCNRKPDNQLAEAVPASPVADEQTASSDCIAVIDLNVVAEEIGARRKIVESLKQRERELLNQLDGFREELGRHAEEVRARYGSDLNDQNRTELDRLLTENDSKVALQNQAAEAQLASLHSQLMTKLLNEIRPVAWQVAETRGMSIVMTTSQVYAVSPHRDITREVIAAIRQRNESDAVSEISVSDPGIRLAEMPGGGEFLPR